MRALSKVLVVLATSGLLLTLGYLLVDTTPAPTAEPDLLRESERQPASRVNAPPTLEAADPEPRVSRSVVESNAVGGHLERLPMRASPDAAGRLRVLAIDSQTGAPLDRTRVRAVSDARFADRQSNRDSDEIELVLTPARYSLLILSPGYEPTELASVRIARGDTVTLDRVPLHAGSARVLGMVTGDLEPEGQLRVELLGEGRRPCVSCSTEVDQACASPSGPSGAWTRQNPCRICGYAEKSSRVRVARSGTFTFEHLVSGPYALRLIDEQDRTIGIPRSVELHADEALPVEMESVRPRVVRVELIDTDGGSLSREWAGRLARRGPAETEEVVEFSSEEPSFSSIKFRCTFRVGELCLAESALSPPPVQGHSMRRPSPFSGRRLGSGPRKEKTIDDRSRRNSDTLRPELRVPVIGPSTVTSEVEADGLARFEFVPALDLALEMRSGPFTATVTVPSSITVTRVRAQLTRETPRSSPGEAEPVQGPGTFLEFEAGRSR